jgi:hypothetical protein
MFAIILSLLCSIRQGFRTRAAIQAEILALRHQLLVLQLSVRPHNVRLTASDGFLWVWLSRPWRECRQAKWLTLLRFDRDRDFATVSAIYTL